MKPRDRKLKALLEQGAANPKPEAVRDPAFQDSEFFDPRDLVQVKYEMLRRVRSEGQSVAETAAGFGVSRPTFYKAQSDFKRDGLAGLLPAKRGPRGPHKLTDRVLDFAQRALAKEPSLGAAALAGKIEEEMGLRVHPRTIERALAECKKKRR
jgi:transposase